jgi:hypothetical protein
MTRFELAKIHGKNRQRISRSITHINRSLNEAIRTNNHELEFINVRIIIFLYASYIECSLEYIVEFYGSQIDLQLKNKIQNSRTHIDKWKLILDEMFKKHYLNSKIKSYSIANLGHAAYHRYQYLLSVINNDIASIIEIRNKIAHGQWAIALNNDGNDKNQNITTKLWTLSKKDTMLVKTTTTNFLKIMNELVASKKAFENIFEKYTNKIEKNRQEYETKYRWVMKYLKGL